MQYTSQILAAASGKIGGLVASHNRAGPYFRKHSIPTNPNTIYQEAVRTWFAQLAVSWIEVLTAQQRADWDTYAANVAMTGRMAQTIYLTGQNHYIRSNTPRLQATLARVDDAPTIFDLGEFTATSIQPKDDNELGVSFENTDVWCDEDGSGLLVWQGRPQNATVGFFKGPYQFVDSVDGDSVTPPTTPSALTSPWTLTQGQRVFARASVSRADGRLSYDVRMDALVAPA